MTLRRHLGLPIPAAYLYKDIYDLTPFAEDITWLRVNIPELSLHAKWKDYQILNISMDYCVQMERVSSLQTPLDIELFKDFVLVLWLFELDGDHLRDAVGLYDDDIRGIYKTFLSHNDKELEQYKIKIKIILDEYFDANYKNKCSVHKG